MKRKIKLLALILAMLAIAIALPVAAASETEVEVPSGDFTYSYTDIVNRLIDPKTLTLSGNEEDSNLFSSYGRKSVYNEETGEYENWNSNNDGSFYIEKIDDTGDGSASEYLLAEMSGAGYISRIWSAEPLSGHLKIYIDEGEDYGYAIDMPFIDYFDLTGFNYDNLCYTAARGCNSYVPITYNKSCRVVAYSGWGRFYQINYTQFPEGTTVEPLASDGASSVAFTEAQASSLNEVNTFFGNSIGTNPSGSADAEFETYSLNPGESAIKEFSGKGAITGLLVKLNNVERIPDTAEEIITLLKTLRLKAYWDGSETAAVDVPLGDFFASSYGIDPVEMLLLGIREDKTFYSYYYMPYLDGAKVVIENMGDTDVELQLSVTSEELGVAEERIMYFNSVFNFGEYVENRYPDHRFLSVSGEGRLVGVNLHLYKTQDYQMDSSIPGYNWWGEGDEKFFVDGEKFPSWYGTGTEDFFGYAWCATTLFTEAYHAQSYCTGGHYGIGNHVVTRLMMADSVAFKTSFEGCLEKYYLDTNYAYTSYLYLAPGASVERPNYSADDVMGYFEMDDSAYVQPLAEGEDLYVISYDGTLAYENMELKLNWSGDSYLFWQPTATAGQTLTLSIPSPSNGKYMILASFTNASDFGIFSASVNGTTIKEGIDLYASSVICESLTELGAAELTKGYYGNTITFTLEGANSANTSGNMFFGLDFLLMIPYDEYDGIENIDLSKYASVSRKNCAITNFIEGEAMYVAGSHSTGTGAYSGQIAGRNLSRGEQLFWRPNFGNNAWIELYLPAAESGDYAIYASFMKASDFGIFETYVNGVAIGAPFDGYNSTLVVEGMTLLGTASLTAGYESNTIKFKMIGKNDGNTTSKYLMGLDFIVLVPVGEELDLSKYTDQERELNATTHFAEGESLSGSSTYGDISQKSAFGQTKDIWLSRNNHFFWKPSGDSAVGSTLTLDFATLVSGKYAIVASFTSAADYGTFDIGVNGKTLLRDLDLYASAVTNKQLTYIGTTDLTAGYTNNMSVTVTGKNAKNTNANNRYYFAIDFLMLIPYDEYGGLEEIDLTAYTLVDRENAKHGLLIEGENLFANKQTLAYQYHSGWSNGSHVYWNGTAKANLPAPADGDYILAIAYTKAKDFGMYQIAVNGTNVGCYQDLYKSSLTRNDLNIVGKVTLTKGYNEMTITNVGKNASSTNTLFGIDFIYLIPIGEYFGIEYIDVSGYTVRAVSTVIDETHTFDDDSDTECNTCGASRDSIYVVEGGAETKYGIIPPEYANAELYPLVVFQNKEFMGAYSKFGASSDACAIGKAKQLTDGSVESEKGTTAEILLRADVCVDYHYPNVCQILGNIIIDLNGFTLSQTNNLAVFYNEAKYWKGMDDAQFTVKNGEILLNSEGLFRMGAYGTYDDYATDTYYKTSKYTFDNVTFTLAEGATLDSLIGVFADSTNIGSSGCSEYMLMDITFKENCVIDISNASEGFVLFDACDPVTDKALVSGTTNYYATNSIVQIKVEACEIITGSADVVLAKEYGVHSNGAKSYVEFVKNSDGEYASVIIPADGSLPSGTVNGGALEYVRVAETETGYVCKLVSVDITSYVPKMSITLDRDLVMNVYVPVENLLKFTFDGVEYANLEEISESKVTVNGKEYYLVSLSLPAAKAARTVKLVATVSAGESAATATFSFSIPKYAQRIIGGGNETEVQLVKDVLAYIKSAYVYFSAENTAEEISRVSELIDSIIGETYESAPALDGSAEEPENGLSSVTFVLDATPAIRFYVTADAALYEFYVNGVKLNTVSGTDITGAYIEMDVYAYAMCETITYTIDGVESGSYHINSYYTFVTTDEDYKDNTELINLVARFAKYCESAAAYRDSVIQNSN